MLDLLPAVPLYSGFLLVFLVRHFPAHLGRPTMLLRAIFGLGTLFSNIFENIRGPADFRIREYSREYRCPGRLLPKNIEPFLSPLTLVDLDSQDILEYILGVTILQSWRFYNLLARASQNSAFALNSTSTVGFVSMQAKIFKF